MTISCTVQNVQNVEFFTGYNADAQNLYDFGTFLVSEFCI